MIKPISDMFPEKVRVFYLTTNYKMTEDDNLIFWSHNRPVIKPFSARCQAYEPDYYYYFRFLLQLGTQDQPWNSSLTFIVSHGLKLLNAI